MLCMNKQRKRENVDIMSVVEAQVSISHYKLP